MPMTLCADIHMGLEVRSEASSVLLVTDFSFLLNTNIFQLDIPLTPLSLSQKVTADGPLSPSPDSNTTSSTSMSTLDLDEAVIITDDPQYHEHLHPYQSQVFVEDDSPVIHVPPFSPYHQLAFNGPHMPPYSYDDSGKPLYPFKPRSSTRSSTKQKNLKYKSVCSN